MVIKNIWDHFPLYYWNIPFHSICILFKLIATYISNTTMQNSPNNLELSAPQQMSSFPEENSRNNPKKDTYGGKFCFSWYFQEANFISSKYTTEESKWSLIFILTLNHVMTIRIYHPNKYCSWLRVFPVSFIISDFVGS